MGRLQLAGNRRMDECAAQLNCGESKATEISGLQEEIGNNSRRKR